MAQRTPVVERPHKDALSALGLRTLSSERAGFEVRAVHPTHYGRICPIETPEGPNIGLISSLSTYARTNEFGFIETPYRRVTRGPPTHTSKLLSASQEGNILIAPANPRTRPHRKFVPGPGTARQRGECPTGAPEEPPYN